MSTPIQLHQHLLAKFNGYSNSELIAFNNDIVENKGWGSSRSTFRSAILQELAKRGIDLSSIISKDDGFTSIHIVKVKLENNSLIPIH